MYDLHFYRIGRNRAAVSFWEFSRQSPQQFLESLAMRRGHEIGILALAVTAEHEMARGRFLTDLL